MGLASLSSAAVATVTAIVVGVASCAPPPTTPSPPPGGTTTPPSAGPTGTEPATTPPSAGAPTQVPVYYLGEVGTRVRLYREFRTVTPADTTLPARIAAGLREMLRDDPLDPDYFGAWPDGATVSDVRIEDGNAVVVLGGAVTNSVGAETAAMTIEQLVWTVTAIAADAGSPLNGVRLVVDGAASGGADLWGHVDVRGVLRRGPSVDTQAPVWLIAPQQDARVGETFQVHIDGTVFEATAHLRVRNAAGTVVYDDFVTLDAGAPARGDAVVSLTLTPGRYTVEAFYFSADDGSIQAMDDHEITVS